MDGLGVRFGTAVVFVVVMLAGIYGGLIPYLMLFTGLLMLCLWEYFGLLLGPDHTTFPLRSWMGLILGVLPHLVVACERAGWINFPESWVLLTYCIGLFSLFVLELFSNSLQPFRNLAFIFSGLFYISLPITLINLIAIVDGEYQYRFILGIVLLTWTNDTAAYLTGSRFGRHHLFPRISPKKTWEGSSGGALVTLLAGWGLYGFFPSFPLVGWIGLSLIVVIFGSIGDLVESMLKRSINVKDSGTFLPGHGGMLDRFDSFLFCIPFAVALILTLKMGLL